MCAKKTSTKPSYLTEEGLYEILSSKYGANSIIRQHKVGRKKIDFFIPKINTLVEFEGAHHYQKRSQIDRDLAVHEAAVESGRRMVHIPYFVQTRFVLPFYFGEFNLKEFTVDPELLKYPNGFIDKNCIRPIDFSVDGWFRFIYEVSHYPTPIREEIHLTMTDDENSLYDMFWFGGNMADGEIYLQYDDLEWLSGCQFG